MTFSFSTLAFEALGSFIMTWPGRIQIEASAGRIFPNTSRSIPPRLLSQPNNFSGEHRLSLPLCALRAAEHFSGASGE